MKKIILVIIILSALKANAQDTTIVRNLSLQARIIEYVTPQIINPDDDNSFSAFLKWRTSFRATQPTGTTTVNIDTIAVSTIVYIYNYVLNNPDGYGVGSLFKSQISAVRAANTNLNRQLDAIDADLTNSMARQRIIGRKFLLGR